MHKNISITIDEEILKILDEQIEKKLFNNRSQTIEYYLVKGLRIDDIFIVR